MPPTWPTPTMGQTWSWPVRFGWLQIWTKSQVWPAASGWLDMAAFGQIGLGGRPCLVGIFVFYNDDGWSWVARSAPPPLGCFVIVWCVTSSIRAANMATLDHRQSVHPPLAQGRQTWVPQVGLGRRSPQLKLLFIFSSEGIINIFKFPFF